MSRFVTAFLWQEGKESFASIDLETCVPYPPLGRVCYHRLSELEDKRPHCSHFQDTPPYHISLVADCFECGLLKQWVRHLRFQGPYIDEPEHYQIYLGPFYWEKARGRWFAEATLFWPNNTKWFQATDDEARRWLRENRYEIPPELAGTPDEPAHRRLVVQLKPPSVTLDGTTYHATPEQAAFVAVLRANAGSWVAPDEFKADPVLKDWPRRDRIKASLPEPIRNLVQGKTGGGYKLTLPPLA
jgi:hypothetical protein